MDEVLKLEISLNRPRFPSLATDQLAYVFIEILPASHVGPKTPDMPLNLALALDRSGSMQGEKIQDLKAAARLTIEQLSPADFVSIIAFDESTDVIVPGRHADDKGAIITQIEAINERGGTKMSLGMEQGLQQLQQGHKPGFVSRMILLTDGETWQDQHLCRQLAQQAGSMGIPITAFGLGDEWNQYLLADIATLSAGNWEYIETPEKIVDAFRQVIAAMQGTRVTNVKVILRLLTGVRPRQVWRVAPLIDRLEAQAIGEHDVQVGLGDLQIAGQSLLVELDFPPRSPGRFRLAQAEVTCDVPTDGRLGVKCRRDVIVTYSTDQAALHEYDGRIMNIVEKVSAFKMMTRALDEREALDAGARTQRLRSAATRLLNIGELDLARRAQDAADQMETGQHLSPGQTKRLVSETRRLDMSDLLGS